MNPHPLPHRTGSALVPVMVMIMVISGGLATLHHASSQQLHTLRRSSRRIKALAISEAGLHEAVRILSENPAATETPGPIASADDFNGGGYDVRLRHPENTDDGVFLLTSSGTYQGQTRTTMATFRATLAEAEDEEEGDEEETENDVLGPFGPAAIFAGGRLTLSGGTDIYVEGHGVHANGGIRLSGGPVLHASYLSTNGAIDMNGRPQIVLGGGEGVIHGDGPVEIRGDLSVGAISSSTQITGNWGTNTGAEHRSPTVRYPDWYSPAPDVSEQEVARVQPMTPPPLEVEAFRSFAQANGWYYEGNQQISRSWLSKDIKARTGRKVNNTETEVVPTGGVMFVDGRVNLSSDMNMVGMIIASGDVRINGAATLENPTEFPAIVSVDGNITLNGGARLSQSGWVYAMEGSVTCNGGAEGLSGIVAAQNINLSGGYTLGEGMDSTGFTWPGYEEEAEEEADGEEDDGASGHIELLSWIR